MTQARLNIAVFIDFDNIEIGVKSTLGDRFDVGAVLEAVKERGEVVTKIAYGDWTRAGDYSRMLTQHAVRMVQRNLTPGGDKNGADINLALDALEMAFAHDHINAFVIVGGDSDFITLVEKLKQYDKTVYVVGGRAFTSQVLQKNCHEFIAYENLLKSPGTSRRPVDRGRPPGDSPLTQAFPLIRRALKILADREVSAQLGLLKSTLLQLDSTFSERNYGASSFRDFMQKLANAGLVTLKGTDRSLHVELRESEPPSPALAVVAAPAGPSAESGSPAGEPEASADPALFVEGVRAMHALVLKAPAPPRWPLYVRNVRQLLKAADESFDERRYGFRGIVDAVRMGQREGLFRVERDRRGILRVFPGPLLQKAGPEGEPVPAEASGEWPTGEDPAAAVAIEVIEATAAAAIEAIEATASPAVEEGGSAEPVEAGVPPDLGAAEAAPDAGEPAAADAAEGGAVQEPRPARRRAPRKTTGARPRSRKKTPASQGRAG